MAELNYTQIILKLLAIDRLLGWPIIVVDIQYIFAIISIIALCVWSGSKKIKWINLEMCYFGSDAASFFCL